MKPVNAKPTNQSAKANLNLLTPRISGVQATNFAGQLQQVKSPISSGRDLIVYLDDLGKRVSEAKRIVTNLMLSAGYVERQDTYKQLEQNNLYKQEVEIQAKVEVTPSGAEVVREAKDTKKEEALLAKLREADELEAKLTQAVVAPEVVVEPKVEAVEVKPKNVTRKRKPRTKTAPKSKVEAQEKVAEEVDAKLVDAKLDVNKAKAELVDWLDEGNSGKTEPEKVVTEPEKVVTEPEGEDASPF